MVNAPKNHFSQFPAGIYGKSKNHSTRQRHQVNEGKSGLDVERVRALGALRTLQSKKKLSADKRRETHVVGNEEEEK